MTFYEIDGVVPVVHPSAFVHESACIIGDVWIGSDCYIGPNAVLRGDSGRITIGEGSNVQDNCVIHSYPHGDMTLVGRSHIGHAAVLHGCRIGSYAMVGINAVVLDGAELGDGALLGANSLLTHGTKVAPGMLALGSPAREVGPVEERLATRIRQGVHTYHELVRRSRDSLRPVTPLEAAEVDRPRLSTESRPR